MASIRKDIPITASPEAVWDAMRDVGALHDRLVRGFVVDTELEDGARVVTFANGLVVREVIVDLDDDARRLAYAAQSERLSHHHATVEVASDGNGGSHVRWIADLLPDAIAPDISAMMDDGARAMQETLGGIG